MEKEITDNETVRELTRKHREKKILFRRGPALNGNVEWSEFEFEGIISHALNLHSFVVEFQNRLLNVAFYNLKFAD